MQRLALGCVCALASAAPVVCELAARTVRTLMWRTAFKSVDAVEEPRIGRSIGGVRGSR